MAKVCTKINEWVEESISKPVEEWEERRAKKCKERAWYDPRGWFCWFVTYLVKIVRWIVVKVGKWVVRTVCRVISTTLSDLKDIFGGVGNIIAGIFTLDWHRIVDGFLQLVGGIVEWIFTMIGVVFLGDTITYIIEEIDKSRLRDYVRKLLEAKYRGDTLDNIKKALHLDHGVFGLRMTIDAVRTYVDSETIVDSASEPNLIILNRNNDINLKELAGFDFPQGYWNKKRYKTLKKGLVASGGGDEAENPISEDELDTYLTSNGVQGPKFIILTMPLDVLDRKLSTAEDKGRELGLILSWVRKTVEVTPKAQIVHTRSSIDLVSFLKTGLGRTSKMDNMDGAISELCHPVIAGVFKYDDDKLRGITACLQGSICQEIHDASGCTFIDNSPDIIWKYVPIHEFGHFLGLCHVDGLDRIMYSPKEKSWFTWKTLFNLLYFRQEPKFVLDEAKQAWDYIVANFDSSCLGGGRQNVIE